MKISILSGLIIFVTIFVWLTYDDLRYRRMKIPLSDSLDPKTEIIDQRKKPVKFWAIFLLQSVIFLAMIFFLFRMLLM